MALWSTLVPVPSVASSNLTVQGRATGMGCGSAPAVARPLPPDKVGVVGKLGRRLGFGSLAELGRGLGFGSLAELG